MTNEEKANELFPLCIGVREKLVEMAEWKDQQLKEYLEKKKASIPYNEWDVGNDAIQNEGKRKIINEMINELFEK